MSARIRLKRGSTTSWANSSKDNKLSYGQPGIEIRAGKAPRLKVGNVNQDTAWASIPYICPDPEIYQDSQIGTSNNPLSNGYFNALTATEVTGNCSSATKLKTERYIDGVSFNGTESVTRFAMCETGDDNGSKTASISSGTFNLITGARVTVRFTYQNTAASPTLNVNSTGAKPIYWHGKVLTSDQYWQAGAVLDFVYIQDKWELIGTAKAIDTTVLDNKLDKSGGTMTGDLTLAAGNQITFSNRVNGGTNVYEESISDSNPKLSFYGVHGDERVILNNIETPINDYEVTNKKYVDDAIASATSSSDELLLDLVDTPFDSFGVDGFYNYVTLDEPLTLETGILYRVTFGGNSYIDTAYIYSDDIYLGNAQIYNDGAVNGAQPYFIHKVGVGSSYDIIVYTGSTGDSDTVTIKIEKLGNNYANAGTATKLATARAIQTNLASTSSASFDGSVNITPGVTGKLPIANGGTNATTAADACANLGAVKKSGDTMTGTLVNTSTITIQRDTYPTLYYNTAAGKNKAAVICSAGAADHNGGIILRGWNSDSSDYKDLILTYGNNMVVPISNGGTGATNAAHANQNLFNSGEIANATGYPTVPGIWRTVGTNIFSNLTDVHSNYGVLIIFKAVYALHLYIDANGYFFWGYSGDTFREPTNWYGINRLSNNCYGANLPSPGIPGRLFYKKV